MESRYRKMKDKKPWSSFSRNQNFAEGRGLQQKLKCPNWAMR